MFFFFFKQKTAYEMRISDWSSDVCSSDLDRAQAPFPGRRVDAAARQPGGLVQRAVVAFATVAQQADDAARLAAPVHVFGQLQAGHQVGARRSAVAAPQVVFEQLRTGDGSRIGNLDDLVDDLEQEPGLGSRPADARDAGGMR